MSVFKPKWIKETQKPRNQFRKFIFKILFIYIYEQTWQIPYIYIYTIYREYVSVCLQSASWRFSQQAGDSGELMAYFQYKCWQA